MSATLAAVFDGVAGEVALRGIPTPLPRGGEILVRVLGCTLCGSDLHSFDGRRTVPVPTILGHEIVGEIVAFGDTATTVDLSGRTLQCGDRVTWAIVANCGACFFCRQGLPQKCLQAVKYGHEPLRPGAELRGGLAEHCLLAPGSSLVQLPEELPLSVVCPASCATATVFAALEAAGNLRDRTVCLFGAGMLGLTACAVAHTRGAREVVCIDPVPSRCERARQFGATHCVAPNEFAELAAAIGPPGYDVAIELSGSTAAFESAWGTLRTGGTLVLVGAVFPGTPVPVSLEQIVRRHLTIRGVHNYAPRHLRMAVDFLADEQHHFPFADLVSHWYPLTQIAEAFAQSRQSTAIRIGVTPACS